MRRLCPLAAAVCAAAAAVGAVAEAKVDEEAYATARGADIAAWTHEYAAQRAGYYLADARKMLDKAIKHWVAQSKGASGPDPYLKIWDAQSQLSAAVSWDNESADLWFEAGNVTFTLAGLMREIEEGDILQDALAFWANALRLEAASLPPAPVAGAGAKRPLAQRLRSWLRELSEARESRKKLPQRLWRKVSEDAWAEVQRWSEEASEPPPHRAVYQRSPGRLAKAASLAAPLASSAPAAVGQCSSGAGAAASAPEARKSSGGGGNWLEDKVGAGQQIVFPTYIYRANILKELGRPFFEKLSKTAVAKYSEFRTRFIKRRQKDHGSLEGLQEHQINDAFFQFQETHEQALRNPEGHGQWPELYGSAEFQKLLTVARNASQAYLKHSGVEVTQEEMDSSWIILWTAVYPQDPLTKGRHGWHTHQESIISGVLYANPRRTPLLFADPRGAPPIEDYEQYRANDLLFEPKAPFDAHYQFFAEQGDLVLFPSWLVHKVPPPVGAGSSEHRVVFPFNFHLGTGRRSRGTIWDGWERTVPVVPV